MEIPASDASEVPARPERRPVTDRLAEVWDDPTGFVGALKALQNDTLGKRIMGTAFVLFLIGGINALLMRVQLARPENTFLSPELYNQLFTMHGSTMMYLFAVPMLEGFAILLLPMMLGNREMPYPRLGVFSFWTFLWGGILFYSSFLFSAVPDAGWFAYVPLSGPVYSPGVALDFWLLALGVAEIGAIALGIEVIVAILRMRAPGMSISRMPLFAWAMLVTAFSILFAFTPLIVGSLLLELDRKFGTAFFNPDLGGNPILWQHLFWIFGHPEVYIQFIPAAGIVSMIVPVFARRPIVGYPFLAMSLVATGFISFGLWVHHMFTVGVPQVAMTFFAIASMTIAIPSGVQVLSWITTIFGGRPNWKTPFLFVIGFLVIFVLGGITGVMVASVPFDWQVHDSYFVVAHFHYVLIGGVTFPIFAGLYYWIPKFAGWMLDERLGRLNFWLLFIGFNVTFFPMHIVGLMGMPRRVYTYEAGLGWTGYNLVSTIGAFLLASGILVFLINLVYSRRKGELAGENPWGADSLEWSTVSPPPSYGFAELPIVHSRHPLWEEKEVVQEDEWVKGVIQGMARWPSTWRAAMVTSLLDARPEEIFRVSGPSIWPFIASLGMIMIFAAEIFTLRWLVLIGALILVISIIAWHWPEPVPTRKEEEIAFEREVGIPVRAEGSFAVARAGMASVILVLAIALGSFIFSYFYIRIESPSWPPGDLGQPSLLLPAVSIVLLIIGAGVMNWGVRRIEKDDQGKMRIALAITFVTGAAALGAGIYELVRFDFGWTVNAYASIFYLLSGYMLVLLAGGLLMNALVQLWAWRGEYSARRYVAVSNTAMYWYFLVVGWIVAYGILYITPLLG